MWGNLFFPQYISRAYLGPCTNPPSPRRRVGATTREATSAAARKHALRRPVEREYPLDTVITKIIIIKEIIHIYYYYTNRWHAESCLQRGGYSSLYRENVLCEFSLSLILYLQCIYTHTMSEYTLIQVGSCNRSQLYIYISLYTLYTCMYIYIYIYYLLLIRTLCPIVV